jgi:hypothetical protein
VLEFSLAIFGNSSFVTRDSLWVDCFYGMTYCGVRVRGEANCYKIEPSPPFVEFQLPSSSNTSFTNIKMLISTVFSVAALLVAEASAHGAVTSYVIDGTTYPG